MKKIISFVTMIVLFVGMFGYVSSANAQTSFTNLQKGLRKTMDIGSVQTMNLKNIDAADLFGIRTSDVKYGTYHAAMMNTQASEITIIQAQKGREKAVEQQIRAHYKTKLNTWGTYLPDQYELVKKGRLYKNNNGLFVLIINPSMEKSVKVLKPYKMSQVKL